MQIYRYFDIGTAKPSPLQQKRIKHYMIDILDPDEVCNAGKYMQMALGDIEKISRDTNIIVTGGTFLYIKVLLNGLLQDVKSDPLIRKNLYNTLSEHGIEYLYKRLMDIDPESADELHPNDHVRITRAIEIYHTTGKKFSTLKKNHNFDENRFSTLKVALYNDREKIRNNINDRVESMFDKGFIDEVKYIRKLGYNTEIKPMQSIGYKQVNSFLDNEIDLENTKYLIKRDTKRYAKRQITWLRKENDLNWYDCDSELDKVIKKGREFFY